MPPPIVLSASQRVRGYVPSQANMTLVRLMQPDQIASNHGLLGSGAVLQTGRAGLPPAWKVRFLRRVRPITRAARSGHAKYQLPAGRPGPEVI
jgi:hypothetical protein